MYTNTAQRISIYLPPFPHLFIYSFIRGSFSKLISLQPRENCNCVLRDDGMAGGGHKRRESKQKNETRFINRDLASV